MFLCSDYTWRQNRNLNLPETNKRGSSQKPLISAAREHQKLKSRGFWTRKQRKQFNCGEEHSSRVRLLRFESWLHHFPAVWSLASDLAFLCLGFCQTWIMMELQYISYLWLCNKLPPSCVPHNNKPLLSQFLWVRNLEGAQVSASGSGLLIRWQSRCQLRFLSYGTLTEAGGSPSKMAHSSSLWQEAIVLPTSNSLIMG